MTWAVLIGVAVLGCLIFFMWQGFAVRCPLCGVYGRHPRDREAERTMRDRWSHGAARELDQAMSSARKQLGQPHRSMKPGYVSRNFACRACGYGFDRQTAVRWLTISNKVGDARAIAEYKKLQAELDQ